MVKNTFYALFLMLFFASCGSKGTSSSVGGTILGTQWQLVGIDGYGYDVDPMTVKSALYGDRAYIIFDHDSTFVGSSMCNPFKGSYSKDNKGNIKMFVDTASLSDEFCVAKAIEDVMYESMSYIDHYRVENDTLKLTDDFNKNLLIYIRQK